MSTDSLVFHYSGQVGALSRSRPDTDPDLVAARRNLKTEKLAAHIKRVVDEAPELTPEQRERLAQILRGGASC